ncbi:MAG: hypothetical protein JNK81_16975 [Anaerolineales bacterium]|nr:hypothetical protein [Anaerolineales bacterium]
MDNVIYSASAFQAFLFNFVAIGFFFLVGGGGFLLTIFRPKSKRKKGHDTFERIGLGCASVILLLAGVLMAFVSFNTYLTGDKTVTVIVDDKREVTRNCGTNNSYRTCTSYVVETHSGQKYIDFSLPQEVWEDLQLNICYQVTYYPPQSLLGKYLQEEDTSASYESASTITRIEKVNCP